MYYYHNVSKGVRFTNTQGFPSGAMWRRLGTPRPGQPLPCTPHGPPSSPRGVLQCAPVLSHGCDGADFQISLELCSTVFQSICVLLLLEGIKCLHTQTHSRPYQCLKNKTMAQPYRAERKNNSQPPTLNRHSRCDCPCPTCDSAACSSLFEVFSLSDWPLAVPGRAWPLVFSQHVHNQSQARCGHMDTNSYLFTVRTIER